ncbi:Stk1 family PASTA domain-containing Ser/Thr kinase [Sporosarcina sp. FA9]|uniref:Stk1 family PASTA domain-containing Ser/Thr kinase n=1 Tax=Sporosarcina sp. FA9 TaxID=3413030 RepID=UPI003F65A2FA
MIGKRIGGRYEILKYIGGGGMSKVYLAHDVILDRDVAIKILNYDFANEEELKRRFMREALSATSLTHPHIVNIFDVGEEGELHYLVMEYIEGQTLKEYITSNGPMAPEDAVPIMRQLVSAISNAHYNGIVHRDVKPQNILMDDEGNVKITDFGIAMALSATAHTKTNSVLGTVHYLSPEQARGGMATKKSDIYSVGIVFYELLTGKLPFSGESAVSIALKHLQEETPSVRALFPEIPQSVENFILKATSKDAKNRYQSADEMNEDLMTILEPERVNEEKFTIPFDDELTRALPAIVDPNRIASVVDTRKMESVETSEQTPNAAPKKRKKAPIIFAILSGFLIIVLLILFLPSLLSPKQVEIPNVIGMEENEAANDLEELGFIVDERIEESSDEFEKGQVTRTNPEATRKRDVGSAITLYISSGKESIEMESYIGDNFTQVASLLANYKYKSIKSDEEFSDKPIGEIIGQDPEEGELIIPAETDLRFIVSKGRDIRIVEDLTGYDENQLADYEKSSGLTITVSGQEYSAEHAAGKVISQKPKKDEKIAGGGKISVVISLGAEKKPIRHHIQTVKIEYIKEVIEPNVEDETDEGEVVDSNNEPEKTPQNIRIYVQDMEHKMADPKYEFTITEDQEQTITIVLEEGQEGAYRIMNGSTVVKEEKVSY